jgi:hypothetical protein
VSAACPWISTSCVALAANAVRWRIEQAEEFREEVERYTDAEREILADAYQALLRYGPLPHPSSPLAIHWFRDRAPGTLTRWCCPRSWSATRCSAMSSWCRQPTSSCALEGYRCVNPGLAPGDNSLIWPHGWKVVVAQSDGCGGVGAEAELVFGGQADPHRRRVSAEERKRRGRTTGHPNGLEMERQDRRGGDRRLPVERVVAGRPGRRSRAAALRRHATTTGGSQPRRLRVEVTGRPSDVVAHVEVTGQRNTGDLPAPTARLCQRCRASLARRGGSCRWYRAGLTAIGDNR